MGKLTWLGDEDPDAQVITLFGTTFVKGEPVDVSDAAFAKLKGNPLFSDDGKAEPVAAIEPEPVDPDEGTERAALRRELKARGGDLRGNPTPDTMRSRLAKLTAGD